MWTTKLDLQLDLECKNEQTNKQKTNKQKTNKEINKWTNKQERKRKEKEFSSFILFPLFSLFFFLPSLASLFIPSCFSLLPLPSLSLFLVAFFHFCFFLPFLSSFLIFSSKRNIVYKIKWENPNNLHDPNHLFDNIAIKEIKNRER